MLNKEEILDGVKLVWAIKGANSMGVSESYYNPLFLMKQCFKEEDLTQLSEEELIRLYKLADFATDVFY